MNELLTEVKQIDMEGLTWGGHEVRLSRTCHTTRTHHTHCCRCVGWVETDQAVVTGHHPLFSSSRWRLVSRSCV